MKIKCLCKQYKTVIILVISIILANLFIYLQDSVKLNPIIIAGLTALFYLALSYVWDNREKMWDKRAICGGLLLAVCFSLMMVTGAKINVANGEFIL